MLTPDTSIEADIKAAEATLLNFAESPLVAGVLANVLPIIETQVEAASNPFFVAIEKAAFAFVAAQLAAFAATATPTNPPAS